MMGKYVTRAFKIIVVASMVRFNYTTRYYPGMEQVRQVREAKVLSSQYRQAYSNPYGVWGQNYGGSPRLFIGNGPTYIYHGPNYGILVR